MKLLVVEDNQTLLDSITGTMKTEDMVVEYADNFLDGHEKIHMYNYDILVIDINLPGGSGLELIREAKKRDPDSGIIIISARDSLKNKVEGLDLGADDYLTKPFDMSELVARIKALMRRRHYQGNEMVTWDKLSVDTGSREVKAGDIMIKLTKSEYDILLFFLSNPQRVLTRESIAEHIWGDNMDLIDSFDFIYSHIKNLRKKITQAGCADPIQAVYGIGYKLNKAH